jgi:DNA repair exonuclease SbcCD nuclease subunit
MKILHTGDLHLTADRHWDRDQAVLNAILSIVAAERADGVLIAGDIFGHQTGKASSPTERAAFARFLCSIPAPVFMVYGNHDAADELVPFGSPLAQEVAEGIEILSEHVLGVSWPRARLMEEARALGLEERRDVARQALLATIRSFRNDLAPPRILLAHLQVAGTVFGGGEFGGSDEIEFTGEELDELGFDYVALGHVHAPQQVSNAAWYAGAPRHFNYGDVGERSVNIVEFSNGSRTVTRIPITDAPPMQSIKAQWTEHGLALDVGDTSNGAPRVMAGADVRLLLTVPEELLPGLPLVEQLAALPFAAGANEVTVSRQVIPTIRRRAPEIAAARDVTAKFGVWCASLDPAAPVTVVAKGLQVINELQEE